jgi:hypothetical protein
MKQLLATRYCPVPSQLSFRHEAFVEDMRRKESEGKGAIRIYMTQADVLLDETVTAEDNNLIKPMPVTTAVELPSRSKRNTHVTEDTVAK